MNIILFILFSILVLITLLGVMNLIKGFTVAVRCLAAYIILCADVILVMEIAGLFKVFSSSVWLVILQGALTGLVLLINRFTRLGLPKPKIKTFSSMAGDVWRRMRSHRMLTVFGILVGLNTLFLGVVAILFPQNVTDVLYNHLSRIGYWIQQGSLQHYVGFNIAGMIYPYNNSLLMALPMVILRTARFAGLTQFAAALASAVSIYLIAAGIGFSRKGSLLAALLLLTYPVVIFQSITAQNDLLVSSFIGAAFAFQFVFLGTPKRRFLWISALALALAIGTNQYALLALPGYAALAVYVLVRTRSRISLLAGWVSIFLIFTLAVGAYAYVQNLIIYGSPFGPRGMASAITNISAGSELLPRVGVNTARLFAQFVGCDGLPPSLAQSCSEFRVAILSPILSPKVESTLYLYTPEKFSLSAGNAYSAEAAWFGPVAWVIILAGAVGNLVWAIRRRRAGLFVFLAGLSFFVLITVAKKGWDPYQGRYLITAIVLLQGLTAWLFEKRAIFPRLVSVFLCVAAFLIMVYSTWNNSFLPLSGKNQWVAVEAWGKQHNLLVQKIAYKLRPLSMAERSAWDMSPLETASASNHRYIFGLDLVQNHLADDESLVIVSDLIAFPDFLFRGEQIRRPLLAILRPSGALDVKNWDAILLDIGYHEVKVAGFSEVGRKGNWVLLVRVDR